MALHGGKDETLIDHRDGFGGQRSCGCEGVFALSAEPATAREELGRVLAPELLAPGAAWRLVAKVRMAQGGAENGLEHRSARGDRAIAVTRLLEELLRQRIDDHVAGTGVKGDHTFRRFSRGNGSE